MEVLIEVLDRVRDFRRLEDSSGADTPHKSFLLCEGVHFPERMRLQVMLPN
jgi:hypothetical protein